MSVVFVVLLVFLRKARAPGSGAALFAAWYGAGRVGLDFLRTDPARAFGLTGTQLASVAVLGGLAVWLTLRARTSGRARTEPPVSATLTTSRNET